MINGGAIVENKCDPEEWGKHWIAERLKVLDEEEWLCAPLAYQT
jgi:hypothetical protein